MHRLDCLSLGVLAATVAAVALTAPARGDPAYTKSQLVKIFLKDKLVAERKKVRGSVNWGHDSAEGDPKVAVSGGGEATAPTRVDLLVNFDIDSANLTSDAKTNLAEFAAAAKDPSLAGAKFKIDGFTDATGTEDYNLALSERRARSVVAYLASLGVDARTLQAKGYGRSNPREADPFSPKNRRVEGSLVN